MTTVYLAVPGPEIHYGDDLSIGVLAAGLPLDPHYRVKVVIRADATTVTDIPLDVPDRTLLRMTQSIPTGSARPNLTVPMRGGNLDKSWTGGGAEGVIEVLSPADDLVSATSFRVLP